MISSTGATYIWNRIGVNWTQTTNIPGIGGFPGQGFSPHTVDINGAGNIVVIGDRTFGGNNGRAVVFALISGIWTQVAILSANDNIGPYQQGKAVAISSSGDTIIVGGPHDNGDIGATWVYQYDPSATTWLQQGSKIIATGDIGNTGSTGST